MSRVARWKTFPILVEMVMRRDRYGQSYDTIAEAFGLTRAQVYYHIKGIVEFTPLDTDASRMEQQLTEGEVMTKLRSLLGEPPATAARPGPGRPNLANRLSPEQQLELEAEIEGCIELVRQAASQFGISPRAFLHKCITNARSAV